MSEVSEKPAETLAEATEDKKIPLSHRFKVLVVDDEEEIRSILIDHFKSAGYRVVDSAVDGQEALEKTQRAVKDGDRYDIIVSDWRMPRLTGMQFLEKMRKNPFYEKTPFVMLTSMDEGEQVRQAIDAGVTDYIMKPFSFKAIVERFTRINRMVP